jgi:hypothetical protein
MKKIIIALSVIPTLSQASIPVHIDGFIDMYYAYDFNRPLNKEREYTTQPARHDEFNVNMALLGINVEREKLNARLSFQAGTYVQSNYSGEPTIGNNSGPSLSRHIQDAYITYHLSDKLKTIAGIMPSHIGYESVFSIDNYTYTRSLAADYSPFYQSGAGLLYSINEAWNIEGYILNGWQNISEDDSNKSFGSAVRYSQGKLNINYTNFFGKYLKRTRQFHDFNIEYLISESLSVKALFDYGIQNLANDDKGRFYTFNLQSRWSVNPVLALSLRYENYTDKKQANITSSSGEEFQVHGGSVGLDYNLAPSSLARIEYSLLKSTKDVFTKRSGFGDDNQKIVFSIASRF